ncbi:MAG: hypothetical protein AB9873_17760 [Syntrophobacteraceae bacterium]
MNELAVIAKNELMARLMMRKDRMSLRKFALKHGYPYTTVLSSVERYCGSSKSPTGPITKEILRKLYEEIQTPIENHVPGDQDQAANA